MSTFVTVGNATQPFTRLFKLVADVLDQITLPLVIQYGHNEALGIDGALEERFLEPARFQSCIRESSIVITHGGVGSIVSCLLAEKKPIVVPRRFDHGEHVDDHQYELAGKLAEMGLISIAEDEMSLRHSLEQSRSAPRIHQGNSRLKHLVSGRLEEYAKT